MDIRKGRYFIDSIDAWEAFGVIISKGLDEFLRIPERKDSITHDWMDRDGIDVDTSNTYFKERDISLQVALIANSESDFWNKYEKLVNQLRKPGTRRIEVTELARSFYVFYKACASFGLLTRITGTAQVACKFTLVFTEQEPNINNTNVFIITEENQFLIT